MPEATVNEDSHTTLRENEIGPAWNSIRVQLPSRDSRSHERQSQSFFGCSIVVPSNRAEVAG
jgi:hypothetical protein